MDAHSPDTVPTSLCPLRVRTTGSGPVAVLWRSLFVDSTTWQRLTGSLAAHRRLVMIDGPSHGGSAAAPRLFSNNECADLATQVLDHLGISEPVDWVGNAWAAMSAFSSPPHTPSGSAASPPSAHRSMRYARPNADAMARSSPSTAPSVPSTS